MVGRLSTGDKAQRITTQKQVDGEEGYNFRLDSQETGVLAAIPKRSYCKAEMSKLYDK